MIVVTTEEMRRVDQLAIQKYGIPSLTLMENAGRGSFEALQRAYPSLGQIALSQKKVAIVAGKGNNAGDGFVVARYLLGVEQIALGQIAFTKEVVVLMVHPEDELKGDAAANFEKYRALGGAFAPFEEGKLKGADLVIDALLGTGVTTPVSEPYRRVIEAINRSGKPIVALDLPSGLSGDTGSPLGVAVLAERTFTMGLPKRGLLEQAASRYVGSLEVIDIGLPSSLLDGLKSWANCPSLHWVTLADVKPLFRRRSPDTHKGTYGHLLLIGGSGGKPGAILMAGKAALRTGVGLATVMLPDRAFRRLSKGFLELMYEPFPSTSQGFFRVPGTGAVEKVLEGKDGIAVGPGMGTGKGTEGILKGLFKRGNVPMVLDADALNVLAANSRGAMNRPPNKSLVLTPHPGEMARLTGLTTREIQNNRIDMAVDSAKKWGVYLVLKGYRTVVATPEGEAFINSTGNPGMATAGMGDVLTGILGSLLAQGMSVKEGVVAGVFLHGLAGDRVAARLGDRGLLASDLAEEIPVALRELID